MTEIIECSKTENEHVYIQNIFLKLGQGSEICQECQK